VNKLKGRSAAFVWTVAFAISVTFWCPLTIAAADAKEVYEAERQLSQARENVRRGQLLANDNLIPRAELAARVTAALQAEARVKALGGTVPPMPAALALVLAPKSAALVEAERDLAHADEFYRMGQLLFEERLISQSGLDTRRSAALQARARVRDLGGTTPPVERADQGPSRAQAPTPTPMSPQPAPKAKSGGHTIILTAVWNSKNPPAQVWVSTGNSEAQASANLRRTSAYFEGRLSSTFENYERIECSGPGWWAVVMGTKNSDEWIMNALGVSCGEATASRDKVLQAARSEFLSAGGRIANAQVRFGYNDGTSYTTPEVTSQWQGGRMQCMYTFQDDILDGDPGVNCGEKPFR
jgi:hypothetical protein